MRYWIKAEQLCLVALLVGAIALYGAEPLDLNRASLEQIKSLPVTDEQALAIYERLTYEGPISSIYELSELPQIDQETLLRIKPLVRVNPPSEADERQERIDEAYFRIEALGTEEGTNVGLIDEWIDRLAEPMNINTATLDELMDLQNVSPVDAVSIYNHIQRIGPLQGRRDLAAVPGLSRWGYMNARNYVGYEEMYRPKQLHGFYSFRTYNTPYFYDEELAIPSAAIVNPTPDISHKLRLVYDQRWKGGLLFHRSLGEPTHYVGSGDLRIPKMKWFAGTEKQKVGSVRLDRFYLGNYQISLGQGVILENSDFFNPRYTGFGFDKRITGIAPDLSRGHEFALSGAAGEATYGKFHGVGFWSYGKKDAILNPDGSMNRLITLSPRLDYDIYPTKQLLGNGDTVTVPAFEGKQSMLNAVTEMGYGANIQFRLWPGSYAGLTFTEFLYDKPIKPDFGRSYQKAAITRSGQDTLVDIYPVIHPEELDEIADTPMNSEILRGYRSTATSPLWSKAQGSRRVYGFELGTVIGNTSIQVEYGELEKDGSFFKLGDDPKGLVALAWSQWNSLHVLAAYRNYDIDFDNPYNRGFSNYHRYKGTTYEDEYYLSDPVFAQLERNSPSPQSEEGVYLETRYQISRPLTVVGEIDNWQRKGDAADYYRWVAKITYRPVWPVIIRVRQKLQGRSAFNWTSPTMFQTYENRLMASLQLSRYDAFDLIYASGYTRFAPRPRLVDEVLPTGENPVDGQAVSPSEAIGLQLTHNFSPRLKLRASWLIYDGFFWNFEDTDFVVLDGKAMRWWFSISNRLSDHLALRLKLTGENSYPKTFVQARRSNEYPDPQSGVNFGGDNVQSTKFSFRVQVDYFF
ncbi:MAG: helix-hairpin-helix domain-containing protein [bacterium]